VLFASTDRGEVTEGLGVGTREKQKNLFKLNKQTLQRKI
jgi:hypothetical protein